MHLGRKFKIKINVSNGIIRKGNVKDLDFIPFFFNNYNKRKY